MKASKCIRNLAPAWKGSKFWFNEHGQLFVLEGDEFRKATQEETAKMDALWRAWAGNS